MRSFLVFVLILVGLYLIYGLLVFLLQKTVIFHPRTLSENHTFKFDSINQEYEELNIEAHDGILLNALLFKVKKPKGIIVFFHGNAGNIANWGMLAPTYLNFGYHFLVWDYREYGKTGGTLTYSNLIQDSEAVVNYAGEKFPDLEIIPYGASLGTSLAAHVADKNQTPKVVLETPYYSMKRLAKTHFPGLPHDILLRFPFNTSEPLKTYQGDIYAIHGAKDNVIPYHHSKSLKSAFPDKMQLTIVENSGHNDLHYHQAFQDWLKKVLNSAD